MKKILISLLTIATINSYADVIHISVKTCPDYFFSHADSADTQDKLDDILTKKLNSRKDIVRVIGIYYTNTTTWIRDKSNSCKMATAWLEVK